VTGVETGELDTGAGVDTGADVGADVGAPPTDVVAVDELDDVVVVVDVELEPDPDDVLTGDVVGLETGNRVEVPKPRLAPPGIRPEPQPVTVSARVSNASLGRIPGMHYSLVALNKRALKISRSVFEVLFRGEKDFQ
jgi:hypothetical protein